MKVNQVNREEKTSGIRLMKKLNESGDLTVDLLRLMESSFYSIGQKSSKC